jgi:hypothetical protein
MGVMAIRVDTPALAARTVATVAAFLLLVAPMGLTRAATAAGIFQQMIGSWRGDGSIKWYDGTSESMRCTAKNEVTDDGNKIAQTLTCANPSAGTPWKIRSNLTYRQAAGVINGTWSESNFGLSGHITGSANPSTIEARVTTTAQNVSVRVSVVTRGNEQSVILRVNTPEGLTEISVRMRKA